MSYSVTDDAVREFADRLREGRATGNLFPGKMSDCVFTHDQREIIKKARLERRTQLKTLNAPEKLPSPDSKGQDKQPQQNKAKTSGLTKLSPILRTVSVSEKN